MATYVALLRGINLGPRNKVAMADLRRVVEDLGHTDVRTLVNSGNVVLDAPGRASARAGDRLARTLEKAIKDELGVSCAVVVRTAAEVGAVVAANPYPDEPDLKKVHAVFLASPPTEAEREVATTAQQAATAKGSPDQLSIIDRTVYVHTPDGFGRSVLVELLARRKASPMAVGTARNWSTVTKLHAICESRTVG